MAHFYGTIQGNRGGASRTGSKSSGMDAHVRGWDIGVRVVLVHEDGCDVAYVYKTSGSNRHDADELVAKIKEN